MATLLFIDDDIFIRKIYSDRLEADGFTVVQAENGTQAKEILEKKTFDLICVDYVMTDMTGAEFVTWLRDEKKIDVPVVSLTALGQDENKQQMLDLGVKAYVVKDKTTPGEFSQLLQDLLK